MTGARIHILHPRKGRDVRSSRSAAGPEGSAGEGSSRRFPVVAIELSRGETRESTSKERRSFTMGHGDRVDGGRHPFNVYPDSVPNPVGVFASALAVGVLIAGTAVAAVILAGAL